MAFVCVDFLKFLEKNYQDKPVAVEFECGGCCKKAIGILTCIAPGFIRLESNDDDVPFVRTTIFCGNNCPVEECSKEIVIKEHSIISVERRPFFGECQEKHEESSDSESDSDSDNDNNESESDSDSICNSARDSDSDFHSDSNSD